MYIYLVFIVFTPDLTSKSIELPDFTKMFWNFKMVYILCMPKMIFFQTLEWINIFIIKIYYLPWNNNIMFIWYIYAEYRPGERREEVDLTMFGDPYDLIVVKDFAHMELKIIEENYHIIFN